MCVNLSKNDNFEFLMSCYILKSPDVLSLVS